MPRTVMLEIRWVAGILLFVAARILIRFSISRNLHLSISQAEDNEINSSVRRREKIESMQHLDVHQELRLPAKRFPAVEAVMKKCSFPHVDSMELLDIENNTGSDKFLSSKSRNLGAATIRSTTQLGFENSRPDFMNFERPQNSPIQL